MEDYSIPNIKNAIQHLYSSTQHPDQIKVINKYLQNAQRSKQAWDIAFHLIEDTESFMVQHYGASTLTEKIRYHFNEIPEDSLISLRDKILEKICNVDVKSEGAGGSKFKIVTTKLSIALASLSSQMIAKKIWENVIEFVVGRGSFNFCPEICLLHQISDLK